jgi:chromosome segregation ATPase
MTMKTVLLRGAAFGALVALAAGATAHAATTTTTTVKHHRHVVSKTVVQTSPQSEEIKILRAEVEELKARLDAQGQQQQAVAAQVAQTQTQVQEVAANAESAQEKIETIPEQVNVAIGQLPKSKPSWADKTQVGGTVFADFSDIEQKNNGARAAQPSTSSAPTWSSITSSTTSIRRT